MSPTLITSSGGWDQVIKHLEGEEMKVASYDKVIFDRLGKVNDGRRWLDYGCGPGVLLRAGKLAGADMFGWDINAQMRAKAGEKIGSNRIFTNLRQMRGQLFDIITCNLVLCIVNQKTVKHICEEIRKHLTKDGIALIGFCNPQIFDVPQTQLDLRFPKGHTYFQTDRDGHIIEKEKIEGKYKIFDRVRDIGWYHRVFYRAGLEQTGLFVTPRYKMPKTDRMISDFVIFEQTVV